jgi:DNA-binding NtrC family response regulator
MKAQLLVIDNDSDFCNDIVRTLNKDFDCHYAANPNEGINRLRKNHTDIVLLHHNLNEDTSSLEIINKIRQEAENVPVIIISDNSFVNDNSSQPSNLGAVEYVSKSTTTEKLRLILNKSILKQTQIDQKRTILEQPDNLYHKIVGNSPAIERLKEQIKLFAQNDNTILITGESGVGKELVARQIHSFSKRKNAPFVAINCAALPNNLIESELFGYERGAFTNAEKSKLGKFEMAENGTIFLDEVSEIDLDTQVKLLRVIQEREFEHLGGTKTIKINVRIIAATNLDLQKLVDDRLFRDDLYYRLDVLPIEVPPLRERKEDIPLLAEHFLRLSYNDLKIPYNGISDEALNLLMQYDWPGNVRELQNNIIRASILAYGDEIKVEHINRKLNPLNSTECFSIHVPETLEEFYKAKKSAVNEAGRAVEKVFLENLLKKHNGNISQAAKAVGINRTNLHKMIKKCGLKKEEILN